ncbi:MAG: DUF1549 and DUF1553 domain-containing protein [Candidatus Poribacteria bacterium]|nr:DUF1549 and DUF1553 domain-containing protein [Candidatus Poribacteria bacterium]
MKPRFDFVTVLLVACLVCFGFQLTGWNPIEKATRAEAATAQDWLANVALTELRVHPESLTLEHARDGRTVLVSGKTKDGKWVDVTPWAVLMPASAGVKVHEDGYIFPMTVGTTKIVVSVKGVTAELPVTVESMEAQPVSFVRDVMPILSHAGCNNGTCHGAAKGKNGFKLSLRGYDPDFDYELLIEDISGRRFNRAFPEESLMLLKPTSEVPHKGGQVIVPGNRDYSVIHQWIAEGAIPDVETTQRVERLEVLPDSAELAMPGMKQQLIVIAHYPDGATRDVTREAKFTSSVGEVANVTDKGVVTAERRGETAILTRYEGAYSTNNIIVMGDRSGYKWVETPEYNYIDTHVHNKLKRMKVLPSELCTDEEFVRRIYFDLTGIPPTPKQVRSFLTDKTPSKAKREQLIDALVETSAFVDHWTHKWGDLLQSNRKFLGERGVWLFQQWIHQAIAENRPYNEFVHDLITATGSTYTNPAASYFRVSREYTAAVENTTQLFLGVRFSCNKCHDHPFEKWTQNQYYELGAFFADVRVKPGQLPGDEVIYANYTTEPVKHPRTLAVVEPSVPFGAVAAETDDKRQMLAEWLTAEDNPMFARAGVNRIWSYFMGRGIIEPVDDIRTSNPPTNPELLDALTKDFVDSGFDMKHIMKTITRSRTYQQSIKTNEWNKADTINFSHAVARRLTAEQLLDAIGVATGSRPRFEEVPKNFRAVQLPDSKVKDDGFLKLFGRPERETSCECERTTEVSLAHAMNLINGPTVAEALIDPEGRIAQLIETNHDDRVLVEELYLATLSRLPEKNEYAVAIEHLANAESKEEGAQDLLWALINSPAFLFNR